MKKSLAQPQKNECAFTMVEVVMAMGIMSFAVVGIMGLLSMGLGTFRGSIDTTVQAQINQQIVSQAQLTDYSKLTNFTAHYDESGNLIETENKMPVFFYVSVSMTNLPTSITTNYPPSIATNLVVRISNRATATQTNVYTTILVKCN